MILLLLQKDQRAVRDIDLNPGHWYPLGAIQFRSASASLRPGHAVPLRVSVEREGDWG